MMNEQQNAFTKERTELIRSIQEIQAAPSADPENLRRLQHYRTRYNNMVDSRYRLHRRVDPLVCLPSDSWIEIFLEVLRPLTNDYVFDSTFHSTPALCTLLLVSKTWQALIMEVPKLWSEIELGDKVSDKGQDILALVTTFLHFSRDNLLSLHFRSPFSSWNIVRDRLAAHRHRIQQITFHRYFPNVQSMLDDLSPLKNLTFIDAAEVNTHKLLITGSPLEDVRSAGVRSADLQLPGAQNLRSFATYQEPSTIVAIAQNLRRLTAISFIFDIWPWERSKAAIEGEKLTLRALNWSSISFDQQPCKFPMVLLDYCSSLTSLDLRLETQQFIPLLNALKRLTRLKDLSLRFEDEDDSPSHSMPYFQCPSVKALTLNFSKLERMPSPGLTFVVTCLKMFNLKCLRVFGIKNELSDASKLLDEKDFSNLEELYLVYRRQYTPSHWPTWFPSSLRKAVLCLHTDLLSQCSHPTVETLDLSTFEYSHLESSRVDLDGWPQLQYLRASNDFFTWRYTKNHHLRHISLRCSNYRSKSGVMKLVQQLALYPTILPALEILDLGECPEWDIFFIMLEQRNIFTTTGVFRITQVTLPRRAPTRFYSPIKELLGGRLAKRPSNYDLSIIGNIGNILDYTM